MHISQFNKLDGPKNPKNVTPGVSSRPLIATFTFLDSMAQISVFLNCHSSYPMELMDSRGGSKNS